MRESQTESQEGKNNEQTWLEGLEAEKELEKIFGKYEKINTILDIPEKELAEIEKIAQNFINCGAHTPENERLTSFAEKIVEETKRIPKSEISKKI